MTFSSEPEWRSKPLSERLAFAYTNQLFTDIDITLSSGGGEHEYKAHRCILAHFSPELERIIYGDSRKNKTHIRLVDVDPEGLSYILKYLYHVPTNHYKKDKSVLLAAYHASQKFNMTAISTELRDEIFEDLLTPSLTKEDDFWKLLELSRILGLKDVMTELAELGQRYPKNVLKVRSLIKASVNTLKCVIDLEILNVTEIEILDCIVRWKEGNSRLPFVDDFVKDLLECVRFRNLPAIDLSNFLMKHTDLISPDDTFTILRFLSKTSSCQLPSWCSTRFRISLPSLSPKDFFKQLGTVPFKSSSSNQRRSSTLLKLFAEQKYSDVCFRVGSSWIKCHRNILAIGSIVFQKMFFGPLPDHRYEIEVSVFRSKRSNQEEQSQEGFITMIRYFYQDSDLDALLTENSKLAVAIFDVALIYGSNILKNICQSYMISNNQFKVDLSVQSKVKPNTQSNVSWNPMPKSIVPSDVKSSFQSNVKSSVQSSFQTDFRPIADSNVQSNVKSKVQIDLTSNIKSSIQTTVKPNDQPNDPIQLSPKLFWKNLQSQITENQPQNNTVNELMDYASKNMREVLECSDFLTANSESIVLLLSSHDLIVKEIDLLNKAAEWIEQKPNFLKLQRIKYQVLSRIRFDDITPQEFCSFLSKHLRILATEEALAILMHLVDNVSDLPPWCYIGPQRKYQHNAASQIE